MRKTLPPEPSTPALAPVNVAHLAAFDCALATRPAHTRSAYLRDARALAQLAGDRDMARLAAPELRRFLAMLACPSIS